MKKVSVLIGRKLCNFEVMQLRKTVTVICTELPFFSDLIQYFGILV